MSSARSSRLASTLVYVLPVIAGLAAGVASPLILHARTAPARAPDGPAREDPRAPSIAPRAAAATPVADEALRRRVTALEQAEAARTPEDREPAKEPDPAQREALKAEALSEFHRTIDKHLAEPVDPAWSTATARSLEADLGAMSAHEGGGHVAGVECRTDSCIANIEFASYGEARNGFAGYVRGAYSVNCQRTTMLDDPEDPSAPYTVRVVLQGCARD